MKQHSVSYSALLLRGAVVTLGVLAACTHTPRTPANLSPSEAQEALGVTEASPHQDIEFAESCQRSKEHTFLKEQATAVLNNPYFLQQTRKHYSSLGYEPKLVISEPTGADCSNCLRLRFMYSGEQGLKTIAVLVQRGVLLQTEMNPRTIDFSQAPPELKRLAEKIPSFVALECEISGAKSEP